MIRRPPRSTLDRSSAASDVYKRQVEEITDFFKKQHKNSELLNDLANIYKDLHRVDKRIRRMVSGGHSQSRHSSKARKAPKTTFDSEKKGVDTQLNRKVNSSIPDSCTVRPRTSISRNDRSCTKNCNNSKGRNVMRKAEFNSIQADVNAEPPSEYKTKQVFTCREGIDSSNRKYEQWLSEAASKKTSRREGNGRRITAHMAKPRASLCNIEQRTGFTAPTHEASCYKENYYIS
eukprot:TRINITY_DN16137_c0_g1_i3.p1 TRINITY_DN16137_c0_g1~~TRINITY_DN16137_c0_g1_i3.p1  ORF type:complete len:244 (+),score=48.53 TRINITY_DN16137_c0_g1_i3:34-732(+)